ncbi:hypothetical protein Efla_002463 [Eimeria flavescens]
MNSIRKSGLFSLVTLLPAEAPCHCRCDRCRPPARLTKSCKSSLRVEASPPRAAAAVGISFFFLAPISGLPFARRNDPLLFVEDTMGCTGSKAKAPAPLDSSASGEGPHVKTPSLKQEAGGDPADTPQQDEPSAGDHAEVKPLQNATDEPLDAEDPLKGIDLQIPSHCEEVAMKNGVFYRGEWRNGKQHGRGEQRQAQGVVYTGQFVQGHIEGFGRLTRADGSKYEGEFLLLSRAEADKQATRRGFLCELRWELWRFVFDDAILLVAYGEAISLNGLYVGQWKHDKRHGEGCETLSDGSNYKGQFANGLKSGHGIMTASNGDIYEGDFLQGEMNGFGKYSWPDGRIYEGQWRASRMEGKGTFYFTDGRKYDGQFVESKMQGEGCLMWPDGSSYRGQFKNGLPHGKGRHIPKDGTPSPLALWNLGVRVKWLEDPNSAAASPAAAAAEAAPSAGASRASPSPPAASEGAPAPEGPPALTAAAPAAAAAAK